MRNCVWKSLQYLPCAILTKARTFITLKEERRDIEATPNLEVLPIEKRTWSLLANIKLLIS